MQYWSITSVRLSGLVNSSISSLATAAYFGLDENVLFRLIAEMTAAFGTSFGWPSAIWDLEFARSIANSFLADTPDIRILELGLHSEHVGTVCQEGGQSNMLDLRQSGVKEFTKPS